MIVIQSKIIIIVADFVFVEPLPFLLRLANKTYFLIRDFINFSFFKGLKFFQSLLLLVRFHRKFLQSPFSQAELALPS